MSTYKNTKEMFADDISDRKMFKMKEDNKASVRDCHKRPDKQLYVPRALRKTVNGNVLNGKNRENGVSKEKREISVKHSRTFERAKNESSGLNQEKHQIKVHSTGNSSLGGNPDARQITIPSVQTNENSKVREESVVLSVEDATSNGNSSLTESAASNGYSSSTESATSNGNSSLTESAASNGYSSLTESAASNDSSLTESAASNDSSLTESAASNDSSLTESAVSNDSSLTESPASNDSSLTESDVSTENSSLTVVKEPKLPTKNKLSHDVTKHNADINGEMETAIFSDKVNGVSFNKLENNLQNTKSLNKEVLSVDVTKLHENGSVQTSNCSENTEDSWEAKFNDEGDCLDPKLVKELCDITGRVDLTVAKGDYSEYQPVSGDYSKEYDNIVELFGFPVEFKTQDLTSAFSAFQASSYNIKWVDDCHALAIFSSPVIASQALHLNHPFIKVRPLSQGIKESKEKARFCARMGEVHKPRPVTSAVLARRLVSGALGLKVNASKEQRDRERNMLKEAKEKKKLKAKQRQDIWNGIVS